MTVLLSYHTDAPLASFPHKTFEFILTFTVGSKLVCFLWLQYFDKVVQLMILICLIAFSRLTVVRNWSVFFIILMYTVLFSKKKKHRNLRIVWSVINAMMNEQDVYQGWKK